VQTNNVDRDQVKAAIRAQQDQQIENVSTASYFCVLFPCQYPHKPNLKLSGWHVLNSLFWQCQALLAEGRFYSDLELTEREIERMVMEASRAEYLAEEKKLNIRESSTSGAEPSSSAASKATILGI
jgi:OTU domain-containing protein 5